MERPDPAARPPLRVGPLVHEVARDGVDWVLSGSAVLVLYGAELVPNDLDVVARQDLDNLERLARTLCRIDALPAHMPNWVDGPDREQCLSWRTDPSEPASFDHLLVTQLGLLDLPPSLTGTYPELRRDAVRVDIGGVPVFACDPQQVLGRLPGRRRQKDLARTAAYAQVRDAIRQRISPDARLLADASRLLGIVGTTDTARPDPSPPGGGGRPPRGLIGRAQVVRSGPA